MRGPLRSFIPVGVVLSAAVAGSCVNTDAELKQWDEIQTIGNSLTELRTYTNDLQSLVDSLQKVIMRQDTALRLIVDFTGAAVPSYKGQE